MLTVLTTNHNNEPYLERCLRSIQEQRISDWVCYVMDDVSTDGSQEIGRRFSRSDSRFVLIENEERQYQLGNYHAVLAGAMISDDDICVTVDGDDWLPDSGVFDRVLEAYADPQVWMTWGSYVSTDGSDYNPVEIDNLWTFRRRHVPMHLRTWKAFLWRKIRIEDMQDESGQFFRVAGDLSFLLPMIEICGSKHARHLKSVNYCYNRTNPLCNHLVRPEEQQRNDRLIRFHKPLYLAKLFL